MPVRSGFIDIRQLEAFAAVMSAGSITGAARLLGKSQPAVTRLIQELESDLGYPLLRRNGPRIAPTERGAQLFGEVEDFLSGLRMISERARDLGMERARPIQISSIPAAAGGILPAALRRLGEAALPDHVHIHSTASENVVRTIVGRSADFGIASLPLDNQGVEAALVAEVPSVALVAEDDALAGKTRLTPDDLSGRRLIASSNPYRLRGRIEAALRAHGVTPGAVIDNNATHVSLSLARQGLGVAIVESLSLAGTPIPGLKAIPISFPVPFYWAVITASGRPLPETAEALIEAIAAEAQALVPGFRRLKSLADVPNS